MKRRLAIILCGLLLIESLPLSVLGSTTLDLPVENASVWYTDETARENGQYGETVEESLFAEQGEATSEGVEPAGSTEFEEVPAYTGQEGFENAENADPSDVFESAENADLSDIGVPGPESDGTEEGLQDDGIDESEGAGIIDGAPADEGEPDAFEDSTGAENADTGDAADAPETNDTEAGAGEEDSVFTESPEESTQSEPEVGENGGALDEAGSAQAENGNSNAQDEADVAAGQDQQDLLIPDQNADSGTVEGIESKPADVEADTFSEDIPGAEQSNGNVLREEPVPETLEGEKALGEEVSAPGESGQFYYDIEDGKALIRGRVPDVYYDEEGNYDHEDNLSVVHLTIPNEINGCPVTYIEEFHDCENLQSVTLPEGLEEIGMEAFSGCRNLKQIKFPSSLKRVCAGAFENTGLTSATIPAGTQTWNYVADNPYLPGVFSGCDSLSTITFEEGMTDISRGWCWGCTGLQNIQFPSTAKTIGYRTFADCGRLTSVVIPEGITFIDSCAFEDCENLQSVSLPSSLEGIENGAFMNTGLTSVRIPAGVDSGQYTAYYRNMPYLPGVFEQCDKLSEIWFEEGTEKVTRGWFFRCPGLETAHLPSTVKEINFRAFADCENLKNIELPEGLKYIDEQAFIGCSSLAGVDLPSSLVYVGEGAFAETGLTEVSIPAKADTDWNHGYDIGVFEDCNKLKTVKFEEGMTRIGQGWCRGCSGLETVAFPSTLKEIFCSFTNCKNLSTVNIPEGVNSVGNLSFAGCEKLIDVEFPSTLESIDYGAFEDCTALKAITVPASVTRVDDYAFAGCSSLKIFRSGGKLEYLGEGAFKNCASLTEIHLPEKLAVISDSAFKECVTLKDVYYGGTKEGWNKIDIEENNDPLSAAKLHPAKVIYKVTFNANGGTVKSGSKTVKTLSKNYTSKKALGTLPTPSKNYYLFLGWYTAKIGGTKINKNTKVTKSVTYYARWKKCDIKKASITVKNATWSGKALKPTVTVKFNGKTLRNNKDYTVTYKNNVEPGEAAKAVIKGKGQYAKSTGTVTKTFTINKRVQKAGLVSKITRKTSELGKAFVLKPEIKEKAKVTYTVKNQKIAAPEKGKANSFKTKAAGKTTISVKIAGTKHYRGQTINITLIQCGKQKISLNSSLLKKTEKTNEFSMRGTTSPVSLGITVRGGAQYTTSIQNLSGSGGTILGNKISVPYSGKVKVTVKAKKTEVYNALTETFTINVSSIAAGRTDLDSDWKIAQNADGSYTLLKYIGTRTEVTVPESVKAGLQVYYVSAIGQSAFEGTSVRKVFMKSSQLKAIGPKAFRNVKTLTEVDLPANLTSLGAQAFEGCSKLKNIYLPSKLTVIPAKALKGCTELKTLMIPANVTAIGEEAFYGCKNVSELRMPFSVKTISAKAFYGWTGIKKIYYGGSRKQLSSLVKKNAGNQTLLSAEIISYSDGSSVPSVGAISDAELFSQYTKYLNNRNFFHMTNRLYDEMHSQMASYSRADVCRAAFKQTTSKGVVYCVKALINDVAGLDWLDGSTKKQLAMELILAAEDAPDYGDKFDEAYGEYVEEIGAEDLIVFHDLIDEFRDAPDEIFANGDTRYLFARKLAKFFDETGNSRADASEWNKVLKAIGSNWNMITKCMGYAEDASKQADCLIDFIFLCITLQDISETTVSMLLKEVPKDSILYEGLLQVKEQIDQPLASFIADYLKEEVLNELSKVVVKNGTHLLDQVMKTKGYGAGTMVAIGHEFWKCAGNIIGTDVDFEAMNKGWISVANTSTLRAMVGQQIGKMGENAQNGNPPSASQISLFRVTMNAYLQSLIQTEKNVASNIKDKNAKAQMDALAERYKNALTYRSYLNSCKQNVLGN